MEDGTVREKILRVALYHFPIQETRDDLAGFQGLSPFPANWLSMLKV
jgi:hypothetical protein